MTENEVGLRAALERMLKMHNAMMQKVNHGASFYDAELIREMAEAPIHAARLLLVTEDDSAAKSEFPTFREVVANEDREQPLYDADPNCMHEIVDAPGGGVRCEKCGGWFCY